MQKSVLFLDVSVTFIKHFTSVINVELIPLLPKTIFNGQVQYCMHSRSVSSSFKTCTKKSSGCHHDPMSSFVNEISAGKAKKTHLKKDSKQNIDVFVDKLAMSKNMTKKPSISQLTECKFQLMVNNLNMKNALKYCQEQSLSDCRLDFNSINKLCRIAAMNGQVDTVKELQKLAHSTHAKAYKRSMGLQYYVAEAEFYSGQTSLALDRIAVLYHLPQTSVQMETIAKSLSLFVKELPKKFSHRKLKVSTSFLMMKVPNIDESSLWDQADFLVKNVFREQGVHKPLTTLWGAYLVSPLHSDFERADKLFADEPCIRAYVETTLPQVIQFVLPVARAGVVHHLLQQMLQHNMDRKLLPSVTSLLLSLYCSEGNGRAALETMQFSVNMKLPLTPNSLHRLQHLLHSRSLPMPLHLLRLKYNLHANPRVVSIPRKLPKPSEPPIYDF